MIIILIKEAGIINIQTNLKLLCRVFYLLVELNSCHSRLEIQQCTNRPYGWWTTKNCQYGLGILL